MASKSSRLILSFDIGTVYTAIGIRYNEPGANARKDSVSNWPGQSSRMWSQKVPSVVMYDKNANLLACGAEARSRHQETPGEDCYYVEHFKMHLHPKRIVKDNNLLLKALPPSISITQVYVDYMSYLLNHTQQYLKDYLLKDVWEEQQGRAEIIVAHPNHWGYRAQSVLEHAAVKAGVVARNGLARLHFVEEAEAAASFFLSEWEAVTERLTVGTTFVICDAGGSTADISTYKVLEPRNGKLRLQEVDDPSCRYAGGVRVDDNFSNRLNAMLSSVEIEDEDFRDALVDGLEDFQESAKVDFNSPHNEYRVRIGGRRMTYPELALIRGYMNIRGSEMEELFLPSVGDIIAVLQERYAAGRDRPKYILLSGGFGNNMYLQNRLTAEFGARCDAVFGSPHNSKPVAIGALNLLAGEAGAVLVHRRDRSWKTWVTDFGSRIKSLVGIDE